VERAVEVHHLTYERLGEERLTDLVALCRSCHEREHAYKDLIVEEE
jgi:5-methylcytosine-specific restriction endonuclease McrA